MWGEVFIRGCFPTSSPACSTPCKIRNGLVVREECATSLPAIWISPLLHQVAWNKKLAKESVTEVQSKEKKQWATCFHSTLELNLLLSSLPYLRWRQIYSNMLSQMLAVCHVPAGSCLLNRNKLIWADWQAVICHWLPCGACCFKIGRHRNPGFEVLPAKTVKKKFTGHQQGESRVLPIDRNASHVAQRPNAFHVSERKGHKDLMPRCHHVSERKGGKGE